MIPKYQNKYPSTMLQIYHKFTLLSRNNVAFHIKCHNTVITQTALDQKRSTRFVSFRLQEDHRHAFESQPSINIPAPWLRSFEVTFYSAALQGTKTCKEAKGNQVESQCFRCHQLDRNNNVTIQWYTKDHLDKNESRKFASFRLQKDHKYILEQERVQLIRQIDPIYTIIWAPCQPGLDTFVPVAATRNTLSMTQPTNLSSSFLSIRIPVHNFCNTFFAELGYCPAHAKDWLPFPPQPTLFDLITRSTL